MEYCMVLTTCPNMKEAKHLASQLVDKKLAACVQFNEVTSVYNWKNKLCTDQEIRLSIKTKTQLYETIEQYIKNHHSYDIPQIIQIPLADGLDPYFDWIDDNTRGIT